MIKNGKAVFVADDNGNHKLLSRADISVFCGEDNLRKNEAADIVAVQKEPMRVVDALMLGAKSAGIMRINVFSALILKLIVIVLGITGIVPVFTAVVADIAALSICFINIIRIKKQR